jgi:hypothetical protein
VHQVGDKKVKFHHNVSIHSRVPAKSKNKESLFTRVSADMWRRSSLYIFTQLKCLGHFAIPILCCFSYFGFNLYCGGFILFCNVCLRVRVYEWVL